MDKTIAKEYSPANKSILNKLRRQEHNTMKNTLSKVSSALNQAQSVEMPNRFNLLELMYDIVKDPHLQSLMKHRMERIKGLKYSITKGTGKEDTKLTSMFESTWFKKFLNYSLEAMFYGNSLVEILNNKGVPEINLIPRGNVIPEFKELKTNPTNQTGDIDYDVPAYASSLIDINNNDNSRDLGELVGIIKYVTIKNEVLLNWSQFVELFGQPVRVATTDSTDAEELNDIALWLEQLGRSGFMVKNSQTEITFEGAEGKGVSSALYLEMQTFIDEQVSKKILGGTMITDSGSSRSQSEVHERSSYLYTKADISFIEDIVNNELIPLLRKKKLISAKNITFTFKEPEILSTEEKLKADEFLIANFNVKDISYFEDRYGVKLEYKEVETPEETVEEVEDVSTED